MDCEKIVNVAPCSSPATPLSQRAAATVAAIERIEAWNSWGSLVAVQGGSLDLEGFRPAPAVGARLVLEVRQMGSITIPAEVVGFAPGGRLRALALGPADGLAPGTPARLMPVARLPVSEGWLGRVVDPLGRPMDGRGPLPIGAGTGSEGRDLRAAPPQAGRRARLGPRIDLGVRALDAFCTVRRGQRLGLFAASGVGKSTLLSMLARGAACDVAVVCLVGERGRELREFVEDDLGPEGLARSVVVCATSDAPALLRREAAHAAMAVAEHFRDRGLHVLLLMDSVTRFAQALREIGLAAGEPPSARGYTPSVFAELPRLLERAGPAEEGCGGAITGLFTVLVDGDDHDEPVADAVRGILDGHVVLERRIGEGGRWPAVNVLRSLSRTVPGCLSAEERALMERARQILSLQAEMADLVRLGAYRAGSDAAVDEALRLAPRIEAVLSQRKEERTTVQEAFAALAAAMEAPHA